MEKKDMIKAGIAGVLLLAAALLIAANLGLFGSPTPAPPLELSPADEARLEAAEQEAERRMREQRVEPAGS